MMYEHETLQDELDRRDGIPDYYDTMYLDGYDVNQNNIVCARIRHIATAQSNVSSKRNQCHWRKV